MVRPLYDNNYVSKSDWNQIGKKSLSASTTVKSKGKVSQNFVAFSEYMNFNDLFLSSQVLMERCIRPAIALLAT